MAGRKLPIRRRDFATAQFAGWLAATGAEVGVPTNPYEVVRYRAYGAGGGRATTHIVYAKENGLLTFTRSAQAHYAAFLRGDALLDRGPADVASAVTPTAAEGPSRNEKRRRQLLERDGDECWFCGNGLGGDATIEHLVPRSKGGRDTLANYALAHQRCNAAAADLPLVKKIELRAEMRSARQGEDA